MCNNYRPTFCQFITFIVSQIYNHCNIHTQTNITYWFLNHNNYKPTYPPFASGFVPLAKPLKRDFSTTIVIDSNKLCWPAFLLLIHLYLVLYNRYKSFSLYSTYNRQVMQLANKMGDFRLFPISLSLSLYIYIYIYI